MHILSTMSNNIDEWRALKEFNSNKPRLPLPHAFGAAFLNEGHDVSSIDLASKADKNSISPFRHLYYKKELSEALKFVDIAFLGGGYALRSILKQQVKNIKQKRIVYFTYVMTPRSMSLKSRCNQFASKIMARKMKGVVVVTSEQQNEAQKIYKNTVPVIKLRCGIDTEFYRVSSKIADVPDKYKSIIDRLMKEAYVIMPGDELRYNDDAIKFVEKTNIRLVRVSNGGSKLLEKEIVNRGLEDRLIHLEKISYPLLRFLLQHATAYAGLVDSSWQPAGWTVACEALASGIPAVIYEGLVSREMINLGVDKKLIRTARRNNIDEFILQMNEIFDLKKTSNSTEAAINFSLSNLDLVNTGKEFVDEIERLGSE